VHVHVRTDYDADLTALRRTIHDHALPRLRTALEPDNFTSAIIITLARAATRAR
jgi:hypothetical protein